MPEWYSGSMLTLLSRGQRSEICQQPNFIVLSGRKFITQKPKILKFFDNRIAGEDVHIGVKITCCAICGEEP